MSYVGWQSKSLPPRQAKQSPRSTNPFSGHPAGYMFELRLVAWYR